MCPPFKTRNVVVPSWSWALRLVLQRLARSLNWLHTPMIFFLEFNKIVYKNSNVIAFATRPPLGVSTSGKGGPQVNKFEQVSGAEHQMSVVGGRVSMYHVLRRVPYTCDLSRGDGYPTIWSIKWPGYPSPCAHISENIYPLPKLRLRAAMNLSCITLFWKFLAFKKWQTFFPFGGKSHLKNQIAFFRITC